MSPDRLVTVSWTEGQMMEHRACTDLYEVGVEHEEVERKVCTVKRIDGWVVHNPLTPCAQERLLVQTGPQRQEALWQGARSFILTSSSDLRLLGRCGQLCVQPRAREDSILR